MIRIKKMKVWTFITHSIRFYDFSVSLNPHNVFIYSDIFVFTVDPDVLSQRSNYRSTLSVNEAIISEKRDFKIMVETKSNARHCIHLVAPTVQDKEAWISDVSQCIDNIHLHTMLSPTTESIGLSFCETLVPLGVICNA